MLRRPKLSIEKKLAEIQLQAAEFPPAYRELNAIRYYLHFALGDCQDAWRTKHEGITNFSTFLREIERWRFESKERVCYVTFNYDTMLEEAMSQVLRFQPRDMSGYVRDDFSLFKLHGSINWGLVVDGIQHPGNNVPYPYQDLIELIAPGNPFLTRRYRVCTPEMGPTPDRVVLFPALSIPVENKDEFSCPAEHVTALERTLPSVTKLITIGWRATETEFLTRLRESRSEVTPGIKQTLRLFVVSGTQEGVNETFKNLAPYRGDIDPSLIDDLDDSVPNGFSGLIDDLPKLQSFLRA